MTAWTRVAVIGVLALLAGGCCLRAGGLTLGVLCCEKKEVKEIKVGDTYSPDGCNICTKTGPYTSNCTLLVCIPRDGD